MSPRPAPLVKNVSAAGDTALPLATETVIATLPGLTTQGPDERIAMHGFAQVTTGVGGTTVTLRLRRGTTAAGALVGEGNPVNVGASVTGNLDIDSVDVPGDVADQAYVLTATAAGAAGTAIQADLQAIVGAS